MNISGDPPPHCPALELPQEVTLYIFSFVGEVALSRLGLVCKEWHNLSCDDTLWLPTGRGKARAEQGNFKSKRVKQLDEYCNFILKEFLDGKLPKASLREDSVFEARVQIDQAAKSKNPDFTATLCTQMTETLTAMKGCTEQIGDLEERVHQETLLGEVTTAPSELFDQSRMQDRHVRKLQMLIEAGCPVDNHDLVWAAAYGGSLQTIHSLLARGCTVPSRMLYQVLDQKPGANVLHALVASMAKITSQDLRTAIGLRYPEPLLSMMFEKVDTLEYRHVVNLIRNKYPAKLVCEVYKKVQTLTQKTPDWSSMLYHAMYKQRYPENIVVMYLEEMQTVKQARLEEALEYGYSEATIQIFLDKAKRVERKRRTSINTYYIASEKKKYSTQLLEKLMRRTLAELPRKVTADDFSVAMSDKLSEE